MADSPEKPDGADKPEAKTITIPAARTDDGKPAQIEAKPETGDGSLHDALVNAGATVAPEPTYKKVDFGDAGYLRIEGLGPVAGNERTVHVRLNATRTFVLHNVPVSFLKE